MGRAALALLPDGRVGLELVDESGKLIAGLP